MQQVERLRADLCAQGCLLFENWRVEVYCNPNMPNRRPSKPAVTITVNESNIYGYEKVEQVLDSLRRFLEGCYNEWVQFARSRRSTYKYLNFFTTAQLTRIRKHLPNLPRDLHGQETITTLLQSINPRSTSENINKLRDNNKERWRVTRTHFTVDQTQR